MVIRNAKAPCPGAYATEPLGAVAGQLAKSNLILS